VEEAPVEKLVEDLLGRTRPCHMPTNNGFGIEQSAPLKVYESEMNKEATTTRLGDWHHDDEAKGHFFCF
jgi:hypothetical protein